MSEVKSTVDKMTKALVEAYGMAYATGYLSSYLAQIIEEHVTDASKVEKIKMQMLTDGITALIDARNASKKG